MANHDVVDLVQAIDDTYARKGASGVPAGGDAGEVLRKKSSTDGDTEWADPMYHFDTIAHMEAALAQGLIPDGANITVEENSPTGPSGDSALSTTSENFVQNKVITLKVNGMEAVLATVNTGTTADQAYAEGDFIYMDGTNVLYKALSAIASGASFTTGSSGNVEQTTIGAVLKALASSAGATSLAALTDTTISSPTAAQPLTYDATNSKWINGGVIPIVNGGTGNSNGYIITGKKNNTTVGPSTTIEGGNNTGSGQYCHVEGWACKATGYYDHAEGHTCYASNSYSHAQGYFTTASGDYSHAAGNNTKAQYAAQTVVGQYNNNKSTTLFEVGNGVDTGSGISRSNAFEVHSDGHAVVADRIEKGTTDAFPAASNLAPVEDTMAANAQNPHRNSYAPGAYVYVKETDKLYYNHLSSSIGKNDSFTGNVTETTVGAVLASTTADLGSKSSASTVTGDDAFSKIATLSSDLVHKVRFTATVACSQQSSGTIGEVSISDMTGYNATKWNNRLLVSVYASYALDGRYCAKWTLRNSESVLTLDVGFVGNYNVVMDVLYKQG